ncbi:MAG: sulfite exporter TauE/SafE family protein [Rhodobacteraceae bacterium]|nr:sulfite exporter TauE/SafE family protein [Paracoccaceae bacterium]
MESLEFWSAAVMASVLLGMSKGGMPILSMLAVPVFALVIPSVTAAGLLLPVLVVSDFFALWAYRREFDARVLAILMPAATVGIYVGYLMAKMVSESLVTFLVGWIGLIFVVNLILSRRNSSEVRRAEVAPGLFWGVIVGFVSFVSHSGVPPYQVYTMPLRLKKAVFVGTSAILFAYLNALKLVPYYLLGQFSMQSLRVAVVLMPVAALGVLIGVKLVKILPEHIFFRIVIWTLFLASIKLVWDGAHGVGLLG